MLLPESSACGAVARITTSAAEWAPSALFIPGSIDIKEISASLDNSRPPAIIFFMPSRLRNRNARSVCSSWTTKWGVSTRYNKA
jgi:hypothetical protein